MTLLSTLCSECGRDGAVKSQGKVLCTICMAELRAEQESDYDNCTSEFFGNDREYK